jgi:phosphoenolpyruvate synthase/pyruvate phosphate dikinase
MKGFEEIKSFDMDNAPPHEIVHWLYRNRMLYARMWEIHFEMMEACFTATLLLSKQLETHFGMSITSPEFQKLIRGFDNKPFQIHQQLWEFTQRALEEGLRPIFTENEPEDIKVKLKESEAGRRWLDDFMKFLEVEGWFSTQLMEFSAPYWLEDLSIPIAIVKQFIEKGKPTSLHETREKLAKEREEAVSAVLKGIPEEEKDYFTTLLKTASWSSIYSEEHDVYCEYHYHAALRYQYLRLGRRLVKAGILDSPEDILFLNPEEIEVFVMVPELNDARFLVKARRAMYEEWLKTPNPPVFTNKSGIEEAVQKDLLPGLEPIIMSTVVGELPVVKLELKADIYGVCGAPGEAQGVARVVFTFDDLSEVQPGDILVTPNVNVDWVSVYSRLAGVITDRGGVLGHAGIIAREYGIPAVVNTFVATQKIKTGQRVRILADEGAVYILGS